MAGGLVAAATIAPASEGAGFHANVRRCFRARVTDIWPARLKQLPAALNDRHAALATAKYR
jgi:hypothetical protein